MVDLNLDNVCKASPLLEDNNKDKPVTSVAFSRGFVSKNGNHAPLIEMREVNSDDRKHNLNHQNDNRRDDDNSFIDNNLFDAEQNQKIGSPPDMNKGNASLKLDKKGNEGNNYPTKTLLEKCMGGALKPPPAASLEQSLVTFFGALITLLTLSIFYSWVRYVSNGKYNILLAPFGALVTLQFGLTAVPPAQPRAAIYGELIALPVSIFCNSVPHNILPAWIEIALAPSIGLGLMQYMGLTHPPAGAAAIVFSAMDYSWVHMLLFEVGVFICIFWSMMVNNLTATRQYPTFWYLCPLRRDVSGLVL